MEDMKFNLTPFLLIDNTPDAIETALSSLVAGGADSAWITILRDRVNSYNNFHLAEDSFTCTHGNLTAACRDRSCAPPPVGRGGSSDAAHMESWREAVSLRKRAEVNIEEITSDISTVVESHGAEMYGLTHRLKDVTSLTRKIHNKAIERGMSFKESAGRVTDSIRFTAVSTPAKYETMVRSTIKTLKAKGYDILETENFWVRGDAYNGLHINARHPNGAILELQFHTKQSARYKDIIHPLFKVEREPLTPTAERNKLFHIMRIISDHAEFPKGISDIGVKVLRPFEDKLPPKVPGTT